MTDTGAPQLVCCCPTASHATQNGSAAGRMTDDVDASIPHVRYDYDDKSHSSRPPRLVPAFSWRRCTLPQALCYRSLA